MLQRAPNLLKFLRNVSCYNKDCRYIFKVGYTRRHASTLITYNYNTRCKLHIVANPQRLIATKKSGQAGGGQWRCILVATCRPISVYTKSQKNESGDSKKTSDDDADNAQHTIIELKEENLGQLKERKLNVMSDDTKDKQMGQQSMKVEGTDGAVVKKVKKKSKMDKSVSSLERNFITPVRAMSDFLLKPSDLENLPKTKRRSPYEFEPPITVYWRKDVEAKALEVWGSKEALAKELLRKELEQKTYQQNIFTVKRRLRDYRREIGSKADFVEQEGLFGRSGRVVLTAIVINASNFLFKLFAWMYTGSHSMFSECIHSAADTCNQLILAYGIHKSVQTPNPDHPYGYTNMRYVSSLISGVGIFCVGTGLSVYHGIHGLLYPSVVESFYWAYFLLAGSMASESATLLVAIQSIKKGAEEKRQSFKEYVLGGQDPSVNVVLMEDCAAVLGILCAASCMGLTSYLGNPMFDSIGSLLVGGLLGAVAGFIIHTNAAALIGRSISQEDLDKINAELEADIMVRAIYDVKGIDMGNNLVRYKAEIDFDGRELTRSYLEKNDLVEMLKEVQGMKSIDELEAFILKHGEAIVDTLGGEIDRMELKLKKKHPEIRHCDLEIL